MLYRARSAPDAYTLSLGGMTAIASFVAAPAVAADQINKLRDARMKEIRDKYGSRHRADGGTTIGLPRTGFVPDKDNEDAADGRVSIHSNRGRFRLCLPMCQLPPYSMSPTWPAFPSRPCHASSTASRTCARRPRTASIRLSQPSTTDLTSQPEHSLATAHREVTRPPIRCPAGADRCAMAKVPAFAGIDRYNAFAGY